MDPNASRTGSPQDAYSTAIVPIAARINTPIATLVLQLQRGRKRLVWVWQTSRAPLPQARTRTGKQEASNVRPFLCGGDYVGSGVRFGSPILIYFCLSHIPIISSIDLERHFDLPD